MSPNNRERTARKKPPAAKTSVVAKLENSLTFTVRDVEGGGSYFISLDSEATEAPPAANTAVVTEFEKPLFGFTDANSYIISLRSDSEHGRPDVMDSPYTFTYRVSEGSTKPIFVPTFTDHTDKDTKQFNIRLDHNLNRIVQSAPSSETDRSKTASTAPPENLLEFSLSIDTALVRAVEALESANLSDDEAPEFLTGRVMELVNTHGNSAVRRAIDFLAAPEREAYGPATIIALCERELGQKFDDVVARSLVGLLGQETAHIRYAAASALGRRKGWKAFQALRNASPLLADDPILTAIADDYLRVRGADAATTAKTAK